MPRVAIALLVCPLAFSASASGALALRAFAPQEDLREGYDVIAYALDLELDPKRKELSGSVTATVDVIADELAVVQLDLDEELEVERVFVGGEKVSFQHKEDELVCKLAAPAERGQRLEVAVHYRGKPTSVDDFTGFHWKETPGGKPWIGTSCQGIGSSSWWPGKDSFFHPEDKPERIAFDVTVPADLYAVSNGRLAEIAEHEDGRKTFRWRHDYPLETYSVTLNVAPYVVVESELQPPGHDQPFPFIYYVLQEDADKAALQFAEVPRLLEVFCEAFGPFPFERSKFGLVQTSFWGMEHSTAVAYGSSFPAWRKQKGIADPFAGPNHFLDYILVHEVAHEWWGNAVSASAWGHFWIHEGFGTYAEGVFLERTEGRARADEFFASQAAHIHPQARLYRGDDVDSETAYSSAIYSKGACVLNTLRVYVNDDEAWWQALREFNLRFRYANASSDDFRAVVEEATGKDFERFFKEWVYGEGQPALTGKVHAKKRSIAFDLENNGTGETTFEVPLDLVFEVDGVERPERVMVPPGKFKHELELDGEPSNVAVVGLERVLGRHEVEVR